MKNNIFILVCTLFVIACTSDDFTTSEAGFVQSANIKGKPQSRITADEVKTMIRQAIDSLLAGQIKFPTGLSADFNGYNINWENFNYTYMKTPPDPNSGIYFYQDFHDRDWDVWMTNASSTRGSYFWMDANPNQSNFRVSLLGDTSNSDLWLNTHWMIIRQDNGIFQLDGLKTFNNNDEAKAYFSGYLWNRPNTLYKTPDGTLKATY